MHKAVNFNGFLLSVPNSTMNGDGFYISYNDHDLSIYGCDTTALVIGQMERFFILNGDHRSAYAGLIGQGLDACLAYFEANPEARNKRSDSPTRREQVKDLDTPGPATARQAPGQSDASLLAKIHAVLDKLPNESVDEFKARCSQVQFSVAEGHPSIATAPIGPIGRFTLSHRGLENPMQWGQAHKDVLPSETCVIASYVAANGRLDAHPFSHDELAAAPRNPALTAETSLSCELDPQSETARSDRPDMRESHG